MDSGVAERHFAGLQHARLIQRLLGGDGRRARNARGPLPGYPPYPCPILADMRGCLAETQACREEDAMRDALIIIANSAQQ